MVQAVHADMIDNVHIKALEEELASIKAEYAEFVSAMSHDFQAPVRQIRGFASILSCNDKLALDEKAKRHVDFIMQSSQVCQDQMRALTDYSRIHHDTSPFAPVDTQEVIDKTQILLRSKVRASNATIHVNRMPTVMGNAHQIGLALYHLLDNAIKFQPEGQPPLIEVMARRDQERWLFCVSDNGIGIDKKHQKRVTGVLQRAVTRDEYAGQGMGLAIFKKIIQHHDGMLTIDSESGFGTKIWFSLRAVR